MVAGLSPIEIEIYFNKLFLKHSLIKRQLLLKKQAKKNSKVKVLKLKIKKYDKASK